MFSNQTYEAIKQRIFDNINIDIEKREGSFLSNMVSPLSEELAKAYINMSDILSLGFIEDTFDTYLDKRVSEFGVYRKQGSKAIGEIKVEGKEGAIITNGTLIKANDLYFTVLNDIELPTDNILYVEANEVGYKYNLLANTEFELVEKNDKVTSLINETDFKNGIDIESDEDLRKRFIKVVNNPSTSGNKNHYEEWALEVNGVSRAIVYPLWNGNGTVKVMVVGNDNKPVLEDVRKNVEDHITENMPIGCQLTVTTPTNLDATIVATIELKEGYEMEEVKQEFEAKINEYLKSVANEFTYSKVYGLLANIIGIEDIGTLTINGGNSNITISEDKIINISEINISEVV
ncbi:baseplate J/gp47 family protein [uncultured Megamonas sp.]|uniref:baseplate J/gp47 family protein n=1 Tax=uncultured Megamonas sp. TaxID=286140 RepID=UPI00259B9AF4|nr:baseplate J/gp47 family protein [uncultured Megamonas sp.]